MLIVNDEQRIAAGIKSLSKKCSYCSKPLAEYPLIMNDDAGFAVFHAAERPRLCPTGACNICEEATG
jgi:hypothetical protein